MAFLSIAHGTACLSRLNLVTSPLGAEFAFLSPVIAPETTISRRDGRRAASESRSFWDETSMLDIKSRIRAAFGEVSIAS